MSGKEIPPHPKYKARARQIALFEQVLRQGGYFLENRLYTSDGQAVEQAGPTARLDFANRLLIQKRMDGRWVWRAQ